MKRERGKRKIYGYASTFVVAILILSTLGILPGFALEASVTRNFTPIAVQPNAEFDVTLTQTNFFLGVGTVIETLPSGFTYIDSSYTGGGSGNEVTYDSGTRTLTAKKAFVDSDDNILTTATYRVKASSIEQTTAEFNGTFKTFVYGDSGRYNGTISGKKRIGVDATAPYTDGYNPANGATGVPVDTNIVVHVRDNFAVDYNTIVMTVNGVTPDPARISMLPDPTTLTHWIVTYDPVSNFGFGQYILVSITASDYAGNAMAAPAYFGFTTAGPADITAPAAITNLATSNPTMTTIDLMWTAPGDDGATGTAAAYDIRYLMGTAVTDANWNTATQIAGEPAPQVAGSSETFTVTGLMPNTTYYFAIKTSDEVPNVSPISNSPMGTTTAAAICFEIDFATGYNLITMPLDDPAVITALSLINKIGVNCQEVFRWNATTQAWESYNRAMPPPAAFDIKPGEGYLVRMTGSASIPFCDSGWTSPFDMSLVANYNLIGLPVNDTSVTNASALLAKIGTNAQEVFRWNKNTQSWETFNTFMPPAAAYDIVGGEGYLVRLTGASSVTFTGVPWQN